MEKKPFVVDADGHVDEPNSMWPRFLDKKYHQRAPVTKVEPDGYPRLEIDGWKAPKIAKPPPGGMPGRKRPLGGRDPIERLKDMDLDGVDVAVLYPTKGLYFAGLQDPDLACAMTRAYHDWLDEYCSADRQRLKGVALAPLQDVRRAIQEVERAVGKLAMCGVMVRPNPHCGRTLDHAANEAFWSAVEDMGLPLSIHEGTALNMPTAGVDRFDSEVNFLFPHIVSHVLEMELATLTMICKGVLQRHPRLRVAFLEAGAGWLPFWLERMDHHFEKMPWFVPYLKERPSEFFRRQCYISIDADEERVGVLAAAIGAERVLYASDYPHSDATWPGTVAAIMTRPDLDAAAKEKILGGNASSLYGVRVLLEPSGPAALQ